jgi:hypothetical protein
MNLHCQRWRLDWILTLKNSISERKKEEKKKEGEKRERESSNGRNELCRYSDRGERERITFFTFLDLCEGKRQKEKKKKGLIIIIIILINWSYFTMSLLYWDLILEALSFYGK